jgi:hypothetical protein
MAVSVPDSASHIPGFRDRIGDRLIVPQQSGALLEFLYFCDSLAAAPFFAESLKDRVGRLSNFRHSSYCRVRRLQSVAEHDGRPALVSAHVAGRRLAEVLEVAARADLRPSTSGVLAVTRQLMASVALLHDFAPYGFHGALGPERLILAEGRVIVAEHVLGSLVEEAAAAWGADRLWQEFRIATLPDPKVAHFGRRVDVVQVGLVTLEMLLGRSLGPSDYPTGLAGLLNQVEETTADGTRAPVRSGVRGWLERALSMRGDSSFRTLIEAQKAFSQLLQQEGCAASSAAWDAFVGVCETAALRVPVVVVAPDVPPAGASIEAPAVERVTAPTPAALVAEPVEPTVTALPDGHGGIASFATLPAEPTPVEVQVSQPGDAAAPASEGDPLVRLREDPFGPWPVATPTGSAAALLESFDAPSAPQTAAAALVAAPVSAAEPTRNTGYPQGAPPTAEPARPDVRRETLFESPPLAEPHRVPMPQTPAWELPAAPAATPVADWGTRERGKDLAYLVLSEGQEAAEADAAAAAESEELDRAYRRDRRIRIAVLVALALVGTVVAVFAPYAWKVVFEGRLVQGTLVVDSNPSGAVISVDGQVRGHTPAELTVKAGEHLLEVQVGGSATSKTITIKPNEKSVEQMTFPEAGERGGLMITTYPSKGKISVDGIPRGDAPVKVTDLQPGMHTLLVETSHGAQEQDVLVQSGRVSQLSVPTLSWLRVNAPIELTVYEGAKMLGTTGSAPVMVAPGRRNLDFVNKSVGLKLRHYVDAVAGQVVTVPIELPNGMMNLYADQPAEVIVDGNTVGETPLTGLQVPLGSHDVIFRHPKYGEVRYTVAVTLTGPVKLSVTFRK